VLQLCTIAHVSLYVVMIMDNWVPMPSLHHLTSSPQQVCIDVMFSEHAGNVKVLHTNSYESHGWAAWSDWRCKYSRVELMV